ncbi:MAG: N-acetyl-gamma-glutamyl-phosphate reductase [Nitrososphaerota archaeon]|nr:N-acetyl-gamma-glutamyl-phosphate reductase [Candidatus Bathyarchaeota archaeon]MDW8048433.1 N-acetyl-gamma-glutamyl-phosphate reductase [Nitrososphaerota archaeon]
MRVGVFGASGYVGGELLRLLLRHPKVEVKVATSNTYMGEFVHRVHPNLRGETNLKFVMSDVKQVIGNCDLVFMATPHGVSSSIIPAILETGIKVIDTSADFRLKNPEDYERWYRWKHKNPDLLGKAVYGLPEIKIHKEEIAKAQLVAVPGCMATAGVLALAPIMKLGNVDKKKIVMDFKVGSSGAGGKPSISTHHSEHYSVVRAYKPVGHRHTAEIEQELGALAGGNVRVAMSAHAVNMVRGILATCHVFYEGTISTLDLWKIYRDFYSSAPFIRFVRDRKGVYRFPDPKIVVGSNYCDIGFEVDEHTGRVVILSAIDNLMKGAAGTAVQDMNIMCGWDEREGLRDMGLHPI